jgi:hypothetical protein
VLKAGIGVNVPLAGVMEYCETVAEVKLATKRKLSSLRMAIELGPWPVAVEEGLRAVNAPVAELILKPEIVFDPVFTT